MSSDDVVDHRIRAYATLESLRQTLSAMDIHFHLRTHYIDEFHQALDDLTEAGENVKQFRIPDDWIDRREPSRQAPSRSRLSPPPLAQPDLIRNHLLLSRVRSMLGYFTLRSAVESNAAEVSETLERMIGFETTE
jgi:hypothetical protein